ncbi:hypothetical protein PCANC_10726 [Puccinia coronata f. sp. avenae]|uniref:Uncharacterized protein n=1 Tax=Puccinia coronata f. sp. avenae TaxID=200324 RepID=A0A2N5VST4_9BASI|nr:hypothetical protein PCANC_10726 [Puccinia coronata f. sp. avenae]
MTSSFPCCTHATAQNCMTSSSATPSSQTLKLADQISHLIFFLLSSFSNVKTLSNSTAFRVISLESFHDHAFNVFYQLLAGIPIDQRASLTLNSDPSYYNLLASSLAIESLIALMLIGKLNQAALCRVLQGFTSPNLDS